MAEFNNKNWYVRVDYMGTNFGNQEVAIDVMIVGKKHDEETTLINFGSISLEDQVDALSIPAYLKKIVVDLAREVFAEALLLEADVQEIEEIEGEEIEEYIIPEPIAIDEQEIHETFLKNTLDTLQYL